MSDADPNPVDLALRVRFVNTYAIAVFGLEADGWMDNPHPALGCRKPADLLSNIDGVKEVNQLLTRIYYGFCY